MDQVVVNVESRTETGSSSCRKLRHRGRVPAVIYGHGKSAKSISVETMELSRFFANNPMTSVIQLTSSDEAVDGTTVMVKEVQKDAAKGSMLHVDFQEISMSETVTVSVPVITTGRQDSDGGIVEHVLNEVTIETIVSSIPPHISLDISGLGIGDSLRISDLQFPEGVKAMDDPDQTVVQISAPREIGEPGAAEEVEELEEVSEEAVETPEESE